VFAHVCGAETYVSSLRIQNLMDWTCCEHDIVSFQAMLDASLDCADTFRKIRGGSETVLVDRNLQAMLTAMADFSKNVLRCRKTNYERETMYLAKSANPANHEHGLYLHNRAEQPVIIGSEAKGVEASLRMCFSTANCVMW
jgi:hypothetical protein